MLTEAKYFWNVPLRTPKSRSRNSISCTRGELGIYKVAAKKQQLYQSGLRVKSPIALSEVHFVPQDHGMLHGFRNLPRSLRRYPQALPHGDWCRSKAASFYQVPGTPEFGTYGQCSCMMVQILEGFNPVKTTPTIGHNRRPFQVHGVCAL